MRESLVEQRALGIGQHVLAALRFGDVKVVPAERARRQRISWCAICGQAGQRPVPRRVGFRGKLLVQHDLRCQCRLFQLLHCRKL